MSVCLIGLIVVCGPATKYTETEALLSTLCLLHSQKSLCIHIPRPCLGQPFLQLQKTTQNPSAIAGMGRRCPGHVLPVLTARSALLTPTPDYPLELTPKQACPHLHSQAPAHSPKWSGASLCPKVSPVIALCPFRVPPPVPPPGYPNCAAWCLMPPAVITPAGIG